MTSKSPAPLPRETANGVAPQQECTKCWPVVWGGVVFVSAFLLRFAGTEAFPHSDVADAISALMAASLGAAGYLIITQKVEHRPGIALRGARKSQELALGIGIGTALSALSVGVIAALGSYHVHGFNHAPEIVTPALTGIAAAVVEETFFRGFVQRLLDERFGSWAALGVTALLFGLLHGGKPGVGAWGALAITLQAGLLLGAAFLVTRRLWLSIGIHWAWNFLQGGLFSYPEDGEARDGVLRVSTDTPTLISGGNAGLEGSLIPTVLNLVAAALLMWVAWKRGNIRPTSRI